MGPIQGYLSPGNNLMIIIDSDNSLMIGGLVLLKYIGNGTSLGSNSIQE